MFARKVDLLKRTSKYLPDGKPLARAIKTIGPLCELIGLPRLPLNINDSDDRFGENPLKIFVQFGFQMGLRISGKIISLVPDCVAAKDAFVVGSSLTESSGLN